METDILEHFGVKGMKWGVRRRSGGLGSSTSDDAAKAAASKALVTKKGGTKALSNDDLRKLNERMRLEQDFSKLSTKDRARANGFIKSLLVNEGKHQVTKMTRQLTDAQIEALIRGKGGKHRKS